MKYINAEQLSIHHPTQKINGSINLASSKSISNRVLIIRALANANFAIHNLAASQDTQLLDAILTESPDICDVHHAGTSFRFLTSFLCTRPGIQTLTGSSRMKERPIAPLVDALTNLGADIEYLEKEGFPPLKIGHPPADWKKEVKLNAGISSQYISSLMLIAPTLPDGLIIHLEGELVSRPYLQMTANIMEAFGAKVSWTDKTIKVDATGYTAREFTIESDWSGASYFYAIAAIAEEATIKLNGLHQNSLQGDSAIAAIMETLGVKTTFQQDGVLITKTQSHKPFLEYDFIACPDLAQTVFATCASLGVSGIFRGLKTLYIKETDRIKAMQNELAKFQVFLSKVPPRFQKKNKEETFMLEGNFTPDPAIVVETYRDHRMAMAFAPLGLKQPISIEKPGVVVKSYPPFWEHLVDLGFQINLL